MKKILVVKDMYNYVHINVVIGGKIPVGNFLTIIKLGNNVLQCIAHEFLAVYWPHDSLDVFIHIHLEHAQVSIPFSLQLFCDDSHPVWKDERSMLGSDDGQW